VCQFRKWNQHNFCAQLTCISLNLLLIITRPWTRFTDTLVTHRLRNLGSIRPRPSNLGITPRPCRGPCRHHPALHSLKDLLNNLLYRVIDRLSIKFHRQGSVGSINQRPVIGDSICFSVWARAGDHGEGARGRTHEGGREFGECPEPHAKPLAACSTGGARIRITVLISRRCYKRAKRVRQERRHPKVDREADPRFKRPADNSLRATSRPLPAALRPFF
jgi:hypothetical protein